ncbi:hypothetical protein [Burkholderia sp. NRF60-BP8]|uniref:hypothetical protein n=1 Tax=Burkholderia sp. NRF60-BP8 TaxID=1637853 RepID=UPI00131EFEB3|nr:hypothetical protein [Burkholderia sp. NRF60-BP8]
MPSAFNTPSVDNGSPLDITRPEYAEHADDDATVFTGVALHAMLSAGVLAKVGAASIHARTEIEIRTVCFIGRSLGVVVLLVRKVSTILHAAGFSSEVRMPGGEIGVNKKALRSADRQRFFANGPLPGARSTSGA